MAIPAEELPVAFWPATRVMAHALVRAGCVVATSYPGSPVVGVAEELRLLGERGLVQFRYATNEKVAFEMAAAAALAGQPAACVMKHVGLNVALDAVMGVAYTGVKAPLLLLVGDDPSCESSSTEQDSRQLARFIGVPCIEPASVDELPTAIDLAVQVSGRTGALVILRVTDDLAYSSLTMAFAGAETPAKVPEPRPPHREMEFVLLPAISRANRPKALDRLEQARALAGSAAFVRVERRAPEHHLPGAHGDGTRPSVNGSRPHQPVRRAFVVASASYPTFQRAVRRLGVAVDSWRTLMPWPLAEDSVAEFAARYDEIVVVEALDPILEEQTIVAVHRRGLGARVRGSDLFPRHGPLNEDRMTEILAELLGVSYRPPIRLPADLLLRRGPTFCAGCPHTAFYYGLTEVLRGLPERPFIGSDIGCYTLGARSGIDVGDVVLCMGAGLGVATGMALRGVPSVALIGDSTFLHSGLPSLFNAVEQGVSLLVCILDNDVSAMTGGQAAIRQQQTESSRLYALALGAGVRDVAVVDPFQTRELQATVRRMLAADGVSVLISRSPCALTVPKQPRRPRVHLDRCTGCGDCVTRIHCPAIALSAAGQCIIDVDVCVGCGLCADVCPEGALVPEPFGLGAR
ncbi:MAG: indolepyruvate ferredoxin oxidoreductase subunit alpha [Chloroflexi bacterium]|nr:indolepyruvate ferredoxin oxidoreductase subunit alpha [Chloroflexota bacterium]